MSAQFQNILLIAATVTIGLSAGLLFAYSVSVNPGLRQLGDAAYLQAMQSINRAIQNGALFAVYFLPLFLLPLSCRLLWLHGSVASFRLMIAAAVLYIFGVLAVTIACNVPLNNGLEVFRIDGANAEALHRQRQLFEGSWNYWHGLRTWAAALSFLTAVVAVMKMGRSV